MNVLVVFVPANSTDQLQPLDLSVNKPVKSYMRKCFVQWYSKRVSEQLNSGIDIDSIKIGLQMSVVKPLSANWFIDTFDSIRSQPDIVDLKLLGFMMLLIMCNNCFFLFCTIKIHMLLKQFSNRTILVQHDFLLLQ